MAYQDPHRNRSVSQSLEYWALHDNRDDLAEKIKEHLDGDYNTSAWAPYTVTTHVNPADHEWSPYDIFININSGHRRYAHISFHVGPSGSAIGSTHIRYDGRGGPARRIILENGQFELDYQTEPYPDHVAFEGRIIIALNEFNAETPIISDYPTDTYTYTYRNKYLKYKNKYLQLKYELGI